jgi:hypothetical protein
MKPIILLIQKLDLTFSTALNNPPLTAKILSKSFVD